MNYTQSYDTASSHTCQALRDGDTDATRQRDIHRDAYVLRGDAKVFVARVGPDLVPRSLLFSFVFQFQGSEVNICAS
jgi:hypothetical protein